MFEVCRVGLKYLSLQHAPKCNLSKFDSTTCTIVQAAPYQVLGTSWRYLVSRVYFIAATYMCLMCRGVAACSAHAQTVSDFFSNSVARLLAGLRTWLQVAWYEGTMGTACVELYFVPGIPCTGTYQVPGTTWYILRSTWYKFEGKMRRDFVCTTAAHVVVSEYQA